MARTCLELTLGVLPPPSSLACRSLGPVRVQVGVQAIRNHSEPTRERSASGMVQLQYFSVLAMLSIAPAAAPSVRGSQTPDCNERCLAIENNAGNPQGVTVSSGSGQISISVNFDSGDCDLVSYGQPPVQDCTLDQGCEFTVTTVYSGLQAGSTLKECSKRNDDPRVCIDDDDAHVVGTSGAGSSTYVVKDSCTNDDLLLVVQGTSNDTPAHNLAIQFKVKCTKCKN